MEVKIEKSFDFHMSFQPQRLYVAKIVELASENFQGTKEEISKVTGIPTGKNSGKVVPHIVYASFMGLVEYKIKNYIYSLELTKLGKKVYEKDKLLSSNISKLLCHYNLCDIRNGAPQWVYLYKIFKNETTIDFKIDIITDLATKKIGGKTEFSIISKIYSNKCEEDNIVGEIGIIEKEGKYIFERIEYNFEEIYVYAYSLLNDWENYKNDSNQITLIDLIKEIRWNETFNLNSEETLDLLDELESMGVILVNKQMSPIVIQRLKSSDALLENIYDYM